MPLVRGDWFVNQLAIPPLYSIFLGLPRTESELERMLNVNTGGGDTLNKKLLRAGLQTSHFTSKNRIVERHSLPNGGYYWKSYDFNEEEGRQIVNLDPIQFKPFFKEIIFSLPNGLHGYMMTDKNGLRKDEAPLNIASDTSQPNKLVTIDSCINNDIH